MKIIEAFEQLLNSSDFKDIAKKRNDSEGSHYRMLRSRYKKNTLQHGAMVDILIKHGYKIKVLRN